MASRHTAEFRQEAVRIALKSGLGRRQVAADLGVGISTLIRWIQLCAIGLLASFLGKKVSTILGAIQVLAAEFWQLLPARPALLSGLLD